MLADDVVDVIRRRTLPIEDQLRSRKWRQVIATVDWLTAQFRPDDLYQIYMFNNVAEPVIRGTEGVWLTMKQAMRKLDADIFRHRPPRARTCTPRSTSSHR